MIIAFYPGAGGNRYLRKLQDLEWQQSNISYDFLNLQDFANRYLLGEPVDTDSKFILTHCMNANHLQQKLPKHSILFIKSDLKTSLQREWVLAGHNRYINRQVVKKIDRLEHYHAFKDSAWPDCTSLADLETLPAHIFNEVLDDFNSNVIYTSQGTLKELETSILAQVRSAYEIIEWHKEYYRTYPVEYSADATIIDIDNDTDIFSTIMQKEFSLYRSDIFDAVWNKLIG